MDNDEKFMYLLIQYTNLLFGHKATYLKVSTDKSVLKNHAEKLSNDPIIDCSEGECIDDYCCELNKRNVTENDTPYFYPWIYPKDLPIYFTIEKVSL